MSVALEAQVEGQAQWVYFNSHPGMGKVTIAKEYLKLHPEAKLIHNHLVIDLCRNIYKQNSDPYNKLRVQVLDVVLQSLFESNISCVFTGAHMAHNRLIPEIIEGFALSHNISFTAIYLDCEEEEHMMRGQGEDRVGKKLTSKDELMRIRALDLYRFSGEKTKAIDIDVTKLTAEEAAKRLSEQICPSK
ncbi:hypothetical protein BT69DRAFT_1238445 [Atractiella rhizophila]|nr:hypothetical protein BT69DRAFT_1238445 [Atractiella rhizophila]